MSTSVTGPGQLPVNPLTTRGTGPLTTPVASPTTSGATPANQTVPATAATAVTPPVENNTQTYQAAQFSPDGMQMPSTAFNANQQAAINNVSAALQPGANLSSEQQTQLHTLARDLGFRDLPMMQHHLRNLSPAQRQNVNNILRTQLLNGMDTKSAVQVAFEQTFRTALNGLFTDNPRHPGQRFPTPRLSSEGHSQGTGAWNTLALASVYNGLASINETDPARFAAVARSGPPDDKGNPQGLVFTRRNDVNNTQQHNIFDRMVDAVMVAHADTDNHEIKISDNALYANSSQITDQVVDKLDLISRLDPPVGNPPRYELSPLYTNGELNERGLSRRENETDAAWNTRVRDLAAGDMLQRFGGGDWNKLQDAVNFIIRYRGLRDPRVVSPPITEVRMNGKANDPATMEALRRMGPENMQRVIARMEQRDGVVQMQNFLKATVPGAENMRVDGYLGGETVGQTRAFQAALALNTMKERIEDDPSLPEQRKVELINGINEDFRALGAKPADAPQILDRVRARMNTLVAENPSQLAAHTRQALVQDITKVHELSRSGTFNRATAQYLVGNWFNVMDSGQGHDMAEQLVVHETSHLWERALDRNDNLRVYDNWSRLFNHREVDTQGGTNMVSSNTQDYHERLGSDRAASSDYGSIDPREDFAEATRVFTYDPQRLMRRSLTKFLFMNAIGGNRFNDQQVHDMAKECGYSDRDINDRLKSFLGQGQNDIKFSLNMNQFLQKAYEPLRLRLAEPVNTGLNFTPIPQQQPQMSFPATPLTTPRQPGAGALLTERLAMDPNLRAPVVTPDLLTSVPPVQLRMPNISSQIYDNRLFGPRMSLNVSTSTATAAAAPARPDQGGWMFEKLSTRYRELDQRQRDSNLSAQQRAEALAERNQLIREFVTQGPGAATSLGDVSAGSESFTRALSDPTLQYGQNGRVTQQGLAVVAALSIYRATGQFNPQEHPDIKAALPESFELMVRDPSFQSMMRPGTQNDSTMLLTGSLEQLRWYEQNQQSVKTQLSDANVFMTEVAEQIQGLSLGGQLRGVEAAGTHAISFQTVQRLLAREDVQNVFAGSEFQLQSTLPGINQVVNAINRTTGHNFPALSTEDLKAFLLMSNTRSASEINGEGLVAFLMQRRELATTQQPGQIRNPNDG